jgi:hypothetical protein
MTALGRPPKGEYAGKSSVLSTRITPDLRADLEEAAKVNGRTLSQEIEHRLRLTFQEDKRIVDVFGSPRAFAIMRLLASTIEPILNLNDRDADWTADPYLFDQIVRAFNLTLGMIRPPGEVPTGAEALDHGGTHQGVWRAAEMLREVKHADPMLPLDEPSAEKRLAATLKRDLGEIAERVKLPYTTLASIPDEIIEVARERGISVKEEVERRRTVADKSTTKSTQKSKK